jgi:hypothetical protein
MTDAAIPNRGQPNRQLFPDDFHLFVYWGDDSRLVETFQKILEENFELRGVLCLRWTADKVRENFCRLYRCAPSGDTGKQEKSPGPPYWAWIVVDAEPTYEFFKSNSADIVFGNTKIKGMKDKMRELTGRPNDFLVHSSLNPEEFWHDAQLLMPLDDILTIARAQSFSGKILELADPVGSNGWSSAEELFGFLNRTLKYSVLRPSNTSEFVDYLTGEVDILVERLDDLASLANAQILGKKDPRWWRGVTLGGDRVILDIREIGDGDFDSCWQRSVIENARLSGGVFLPRDIDLLFTTLHHAATEKNPSNYLERVAPLARSMGFNISGDASEQWSALLELLFAWLKTNQFQLSFHAARHPNPDPSFFSVLGGRVMFTRNFQQKFTAFRTAARFLFLWMRFRAIRK